MLQNIRKSSQNAAEKKKKTKKKMQNKRTNNANKNEKMKKSGRVASSGVALGDWERKTFKPSTCLICSFYTITALDSSFHQ